MVRSCIPSLLQLSHLFSYSSPQPPSSSPPAHQQSCDLNSLPYSSWRPPTCPQKCKGVCPHLPVGSDTRVNGHPIAGPQTQKVDLLSAKDVERREHVQTSVTNPETSGPIKTTTEKKVGTGGGPSGSGASVISTAPPASPVEKVDGEHTPDLSSLFDKDDNDGSTPNAKGKSPYSPSRSSHAQNHGVAAIQQASTTPHKSPADSSVPHASDSNDASTAGSYGVDVNRDDEEDTTQTMTWKRNTPPEDENGCSLRRVLVADESTSRAPFSPAINIRGEACVDVDIGASPNVVQDVAQRMDTGIDTTSTDAKDSGTLGHVYFQDVKVGEVKRRDSIAMHDSVDVTW